MKFIDDPVLIIMAQYVVNLQTTIHDIAMAFTRVDD